MNYSIITCTYNAEKYINQYMECISKINYKDFEVIVVDDNSTDNTYELLKQNFEKCSVKYKIYKQTINQGPGEARNRALDNAKGDRILFLDIDDIISGECLNIFDKQHQFDILFFDYYRSYPDGKLIKKSILQGQCDENSINSDYMMGTTGSVWGKVYIRSIIVENQIRFPALYKSEDLVFLIKYLTKCKKQRYLKYPLYYYTISQNSLMHRDIQGQIDYAACAIDLLQPILIEYKEVFNVLFCKEILYDFTNIYISVGENRNFIKEFWKHYPIPIKIFKYRKYFTKIQLISLYLIKGKMYLLLKLLVNFKNNIL